MAEPNKMLIDATHPEETRVVVLRGGRVEEFDYESAARKQLRGNIYLAKVTRVEPSLQAAFVEYGGNRHGFLAFNEIHPDYYQIPVADRIALIEEEAAAEAAEEAAAEARAEARAKREAAREAARLQRGGPPGKGAATSYADANAADDDDQDDEEEDDDDEVSEISTIENTDGVASYPESDGDGHDEGSEDGPGDDVRSASSTQAESRGLGEDRISEAPSSESSDEEPRADAPGDHDHANCDHDHHPHEHASHETEDAGTEAVSMHAEDVGGEHDDADAGDRHAEAGGERHSHKAKSTSGGANGSGNGEADETVEQVGAEDALEELPSRPRRRMRNYKIQEVIKRRQVILVQVVKEERGNKGAALTTYLSLAGRYTVLMPNTARGGGISRKITQPQDRKRLKAIAAELEVPEGMGLIIRTAGAARTKQEIKRDFEYLLRLWESVRDLTLQSTAPSLVYEEGNLIKRSIRDLYNKDVEEVIVAGDEAFVEARDFMRMLMPSHAKNVIRYAAPEPLFTRYQIERQLNAMFSPYVTLKSGGYLVINQTEALVAVDVNSGKSTREFSIEETALNTNLEASDEIARQLKLRDLAGLIVVDFIDMEEKRNNRSVERRLKDALRFDRARIQVGRISHFGLMEMSRQRLRTGVLEGSTSQCPHCQGTGIIRSVESVALAVLRGLEDAVMAGARTSLIAVTTPSVALYILNKKRNFIIDMEVRLGMPIHVEGSDKMQGANFAIEKGTAPALPAGRPQRTAVNMDWGFGDDEEVADNDTAAVEAEEVPEPRETRGGREERNGRGDRDRDGEGDGETNGDGRRRRRRRRRGRRGDREAGAGSSGETGSNRDSFEDDEADTEDDTVTTIGEGASHAAHDGEVDSDDADTENGEGDDDEANGENPEQADANGDQPRRRRRRGRRGGRRNRDRQDRPNEDGEVAASGDVAGGVDDDARPVDATAPTADDGSEAAATDVAAHRSEAEPQREASPVAENPAAPPVVDEPVAAAAAPETVPGAEPSGPAGAEAEAETKPRRNRGEPVSSAPRMERVVVSTDPSGGVAAASGETDSDGQPTRKGWWQRRFGV